MNGSASPSSLDICEDQDNKENQASSGNGQPSIKPRRSIYKLFDPFYDSPVARPTTPFEKVDEDKSMKEREDESNSLRPTPSHCHDVFESNNLVQIGEDNHEQVDMDLEEAEVETDEGNELKVEAEVKTGEENELKVGAGVKTKEGNELRVEACTCGVNGAVGSIKEPETGLEKCKFNKLAEQVKNYEIVFQSYEIALNEWKTKYNGLDNKYKIQTKSFETFETAFHDLLKKYEESKKNLADMKKREDTLLSQIHDFRKLLEEQEMKYKTMKEKVMEKIKSANEVNREIRLRNASEVNKLNYEITELKIALSAKEI